MPDPRTTDPTKCPACGLKAAAADTTTKILDATHAEVKRKCAKGHEWGGVVEVASE